MSFDKVFAVVIAATLCGCSYTGAPIAVSANNVYSSYSDKLPGKYLLYVDATALDTTLRPAGLNCSAHTYPIAMSAGFKTSALQMVQNLVASVELVEQPLDRAALTAVGAKGMILVKGEQVNARFQAIEGFFEATVQADIDIDASITVDGRSDRLLGQSVTGTGHGSSGSGMMCEGGADAVQFAAEDAMKEALTRLGESLVNSDRVRRS